MPSCGYFLLCCAVSVTALHGQVYSAPRFDVERGPFTVGLKVVEQYDRHRPFGTAPDQTGNSGVGNQPRPLQTLIWYPAQKSSLHTMTVGDYLALTKSETSFGTPQETPTSKEWTFYLGAVESGAMQATRDAPMSKGRYPVIIYSPSFSSVSWENADLCEYLASSGYVVIAVPAMGATTRESTHDLKGVEAQAEDVSFLINFAGSLTDTDITRVAAVGFSWGGLANLLAAGQDQRIDALVSLDGSERYFPGFVKQSGFAQPEQMKIPLIYFEEGDQSVEAQDAVTTKFHSQGPSVLNAWQHGDLITAHMLGLFHPAFYSMSYRNEDIWKTEFKNLQVADYDYEDCLLQFSWVMRYTRAFLDAYLKDNSSALNLLKAAPRASGVPKHEIELQLRAAKPIASTK